MNKYFSFTCTILQAIVLSFLLTQISLADIHLPGSDTVGPIRKLSRGISNILFAPTEIKNAFLRLKDSKTSISNYPYGMGIGLGRTFVRMGYGLLETATFLIPLNQYTYNPPYNTNPQKENFYSEFPQ